MSNNKSPGSDGFSSEFLKMFWKELGHFIVRSLNYGYDCGELSITQKQGIITCIPKEGKPRQYMKNWRPISLLNVIYKIASAAIANRVKPLLQNIISSDQTGFVPGRYIGENTRLIYDLLNYTEEHNIPGTLLIIDFEKAFDSVSWDFIDRTLQFFNFGTSFRRWISVFQKGSISAVTQAGFLSPFFPLGRGCRQGDPISSYIFLLCAEILAVKIKNNRNIRGITISDTEYKITQYADDTSVILDGTERSLKEAITEINAFYKLSGLKMNLSKTQITWIGSKKYSADKLCNELNLIWTNTFTLLGIHFDVDLSRINFLNYDKKLVKIKSIIKQWSKRSLTPLGRLSIIKTLLISQLNHLFIALPNPNDKFIQELNQTLFNFLWNSKIDRVKRDVITQDYDKGGIKMIDLRSYIESLKTTWIRRIIKGNDSKWKLLTNEIFEVDKLFNVGPGIIETTVRNIKNRFWKDVLNSWSHLQRLTKVEKWEEYIAQPIWYKTGIKIDNKYVFYDSLYRIGIKHINDLLKANGDFYSHREFELAYNSRINFLNYISLISAILKDIKNKKVVAKQDKLINPFIPYQIQIFLKSVKGSQDMYKILCLKSTTPSGKLKWNTIFGFSDQRWREIYRLPFISFCSIKMRWFQFRINHFILGTNKLLFKIGKCDSQLCTFCDSDIETIIHVLWECDVVQNFIKSISDYLARKNLIFEPTRDNFIFGSPSEDLDCHNNILVTIKFYIYKTKCLNKPLNLQSLLFDVRNLYVTSKIISIKSGKFDVFSRKWNTWSFLENL